MLQLIFRLILKLTVVKNLGFIRRLRDMSRQLSEIRKQKTSNLSLKCSTSLSIRAARSGQHVPHNRQKNLPLPPPWKRGQSCLAICQTRDARMCEKIAPITKSQPAKANITVWKCSLHGFRCLGFRQHFELNWLSSKALYRDKSLEKINIKIWLLVLSPTGLRWKWPKEMAQKDFFNKRRNENLKKLNMSTIIFLKEEIEWKFQQKLQPSDPEFYYRRNKIEINYQPSDPSFGPPPPPPPPENQQKHLGR